MPNQELLLTEITNIIKTDYLPIFDNLLTIEPSPFLEMVQKENLVSDDIKAAAPIGLVGGFGYSTEGAATPAAGRQNYLDLTCRTADMYVNIEISNKSIQLAQSNMAIMINAVDAEIQGGFKAAKYHMARSLFGDGSGVLAKATSAGTGAAGANTVTLDTVKLLREGVTIDIYATGTTTPAATQRRILAINRTTNTITFDGASYTAAVDDFITVQGSYQREIIGLGSIYGVDYNGNANGRTHIYNQDISKYPLLIPETIDANNDITDIVLYDAVRYARDYKNTEIDLFMCGDEAFTAYHYYMVEHNIQVLDKRDFKGGAKGFAVVVGDREVVIVNEHFVPTNEIWGVNTKDWSFKKTQLVFANYDGSSGFILIPGTSIFRGLMACYGNLICENPGGSVRIIRANRL